MSAPTQTLKLPPKLTILATCLGVTGRDGKRRHCWSAFQLELSMMFLKVQHCPA